MVNALPSRSRKDVTGITTCFGLNTVQELSLKVSTEPIAADRGAVEIERKVAFDPSIREMSIW